MDKKVRNVILSDYAWELAKKAAEAFSPRVSRPSWIEHAIIETADRENGGVHNPPVTETRVKGADSDF